MWQIKVKNNNMENDFFSFLNIKSLFFENKTLHQTIFKNTFWLFIAEVIESIIGFFVVIWMARHFGPENFGEWSFALSFVSLFAIFSDLGFNTLINRELARNQSKSGQYIDNMIFMKIISAFVMFGVIFIVSQFLRNESASVNLIYFLALYIIINSFGGLFQSVFRSGEKMQYETFCRILQSVILFGLTAFVILEGYSIFFVSYAYLSASFVGLISSLLLVWRYFSKFFIKIDFKICWEIISESWSIGLSTFSASIYYFLGPVFLGIMQSNDQVGWYNAAFRLAFSISIFLNVLFPVFLSPISKHLKNNKELNILGKNYFTIIFGLGIPFVVGGIVLAHDLINFLYKSDYLNAILPFQILLIFIFTAFVNSVFYTFLLAENKQKEFLKAVLIGLAFNIVLNLLLIPKYGAAGVAVSMSLTEIIIFIKSSLEFNKTIKVLNFLKLSLLPICASIIMALCLFIEKKSGLYNTILLILSGIGVYFIFYFLILLFYQKILYYNHEN